MTRPVGFFQAIGDGNAASDARRHAVEIIALCNDAECPELASRLITEGISIEEARTRIDLREVAVALVKLAREHSISIPMALADELVAQKLSAAEMRVRLLDALADATDAVCISGIRINPASNHSLKDPPNADSP